MDGTPTKPYTEDILGLPVINIRYVPLSNPFNAALKRTFDINDGKLIDYYDSEAALDDELLNKYLAKTKQAVLGEIIATIQKEQNEIIRLSPRHNLIVQGVDAKAARLMEAVYSTFSIR